MGITILQQIDGTLLALRHRLRLMRWLIPLLMVVLVIAFELLVGHWLLDRYGRGAHLVAEILLYGTFGPLLAFVLLDYFGRWIDERDTSDYQAQLVVQARTDARRSRALVDDAVQALFSAGNLIAVLEEEAQACGLHQSSIPTGSTQAALDEIIASLREHLQEEPVWTGNGKGK